MKLMICVLVLAVSLAMAGATAGIEGTSGTNWYPSDAETILWEQPPTGIAQGSQYFTDLYPEYDAGVADDFMFPVDTKCNKIKWWGSYWSNTDLLPIEAPVEIYLYEDDGTGNAPTLPQHSSAIASWMIPWGDYDEVADANNFLCTYEFPEWVWFDANVTYWVEIRKAFALDPYGQYGFVESDPGFMAPCVQGFDGLTPPVLWWTPRPAGAAFVLIWDDALTLESSTWADIKTIF